MKTYRNDTGAARTVMTEPPQLVEPGWQITVPDDVHIAGLQLTADGDEVDDDGQAAEAGPVVGYGGGQLGDSDASAVPAGVTEVLDPDGGQVPPPSADADGDRLDAPTDDMDGFSGDEDNADPAGRLTDPVDAPAPADNEQNPEATP